MTLHCKLIREYEYCLAINPVGTAVSFLTQKLSGFFVRISIFLMYSYPAKNKIKPTYVVKYQAWNNNWTIITGDSNWLIPILDTALLKILIKH